jgi:hypothetical protein
VADQIDEAQEMEAWYRGQALDTREVTAGEMPFTGECYNCTEVIEHGNFCDTNCRDDYQLRKKQESQRV